jgi:hypothetical protein
MPIEKTHDVFPIEVTPKWGKGALGTWRSQGWSVNRETGMSHHKDQSAKQTNGSGAYVCQHLSFIVGGKACRGKAKVRTESGKSRCSGSQGGLRKHEYDGSRIEAQWEITGSATVP